LGDWDDNETALPERLEISSEIIKSFGTAGLELTMTSFMGKKEETHQFPFFYN
jgi:PTH1 family peptidyl-tRNA hydrolase